ncbi:P-type conjugative transfer ATPase TrbB [Nitratidesulfovibrio vulgaris]|jgi:type IV secretion system protein VirB11|uniref:P-type conjugative transfer ATPase TrbB n=1 Tax=Nitratidesulfovibrio vulgaris TaxID=881 RepID=UPI00230085D9|nr:P-type conjugative transfer ATPase TrbB [Nitratidesulfovibrio vulgaris]WCB46528.1 P-type conjugative transfer ATPase TrbB [Nitratidesulfovibrio vulgaris]
MNRLLASLQHNLGPAIAEALTDPAVVEIALNPDGTLWIERAGEPMTPAGSLEPDKGRLVVSLVATALGTTVTAERPVVEGELPLDGSRFEGLLPPIVASPSFSIRKRCSRIISLTEYVDSGVMPSVVRDAIVQAVLDRRNILVVGGTGTGKTTLVNGVIQAMADLCPSDRLVIIEDTSELQSASANTVFLRSSDYVSIRDLVRATMRLRPDRILVGEVRGGEALDLLKAWNTGHSGGVATVHANGAVAGLIRLEQLIGEASASPMQTLIGEAIDIVVYLRRSKAGREVAQVASVAGFNWQTKNYSLEMIYDADA